MNKENLENSQEQEQADIQDNPQEIPSWFGEVESTPKSIMSVDLTKYQPEPHPQEIENELNDLDEWDDEIDTSDPEIFAKLGNRFQRDAQETQEGNINEELGIRVFSADDLKAENEFDLFQIQKQVLESENEVNPNTIRVYKEEASSVTVILGKVTEANKYRIEDMKENYLPYVEQVNSMKELLTKYRRSKAPLLRNKKLLILPIRLDYKSLLNLMAIIEDINNPTADIIIILEKQGLYNTIPDSIKVINLNQFIKEDFTKYVKSKLDNITDNGVKTLLSKIGYSYKQFDKYYYTLVEYPEVTDKVIKDVITQPAVETPERVLEWIINKEKKGYKQYLALCERYSRNWVESYFLKTLNYVMKLKVELFKEELKPHELNTKNKFKYKNLVMYTRTKDIINLIAFLKNGKYPIEKYIYDVDPLKPDEGLVNLKDIIKGGQI